MNTFESIACLVIGFAVVIGTYLLADAFRCGTFWLAILLSFIMAEILGIMLRIDRMKDAINQNIKYTNELVRREFERDGSEDGLVENSTVK